MPEINLINLFQNDDDAESLGPGEILFREGNEGEKMYVVIDGNIDISVNGVSLLTVRPGELFGEMALIDTGPRSATATALTASRVVPIDRKRFAFLVQQTPYFALHVMRVLAYRLRNMDKRIVS
jgi:CRP-like cAMP-binding protein